MKISFLSESVICIGFIYTKKMTQNSFNCMTGQLHNNFRSYYCVFILDMLIRKTVGRQR